MYRTHSCGELRIKDLNKEVILSGWVQQSRDLGGMTFIDLRDRYGITQLVFNMDVNSGLCLEARELGREYVVQIKGKVTERSNKNKNIPTGDIEIIVSDLNILNRSDLPPFTIITDTDGGDELRMKYRYLDLRREPLKRNMILRHRMAKETRKYMDSQGFIEIETPFLIKSTPEGARDFIVPSRMSPGEFYALPQSPQTFKQILMVAGYDKYYQIVRCFRDEDLRADRQPEFTQIDCEMSFVTQDEILNTFEGLIKHLFKSVKGIDIHDSFERMSYKDAMDNYGSDKPDLRFGMQIKNLTDLVKGKGFGIFDNAEYTGGICAKGCGDYSRKQLDELTGFVRRPQIGAKGLVYARVLENGTVRSSVDKFYSAQDLGTWSERFNAAKGDLMLILAGERYQTLSALNELRLELGKRLGLRDKNRFIPLWVVDFPLLEWDDETKRYYAMHHPFTSPKPEDMAMLETSPGDVRANAYDLVINGIEIGGGSIRIHNKDLQQKMFKALGFTEKEAQHQFGFLMDAFRYGAPPHGGIAFGFDRLVSLFAGLDSIRDVIAFPKNNVGKDVMIDTPSAISEEQLKELKIQINLQNQKKTRES
ncbi:MAG: aspartate--tRNA ligase [Bacteroidales bacterium]|nr:aspartate--tRNA ligase [Bacteroidales bacterium]